MRHLLSVGLALVLTPLIYIATGLSAIKFGEANELGDIEIVPALVGLFAAFVAGALYALLVMARLSPVGPVFAGVVYLGLTLWALLAPSGFLNTMPARLFGVDDVLYVPVGFGTALLAVPLLFTVFSPRRWRRNAQPGAVAYQAAPAYPPAPGSAAPSYDTSPSYETPATPAPTYEPPVYTPAPPAAPTYPSVTEPAQATPADASEGDDAILR